MNLEDHLGDILRKARTSAGVSAVAASKTAGLSSRELDTLEQTGQVKGSPDLRALARLVGLDPDKLEGLARGWQPAERPLSRWRQLRQIVTTEGGNTVNCFLAWDEISREAALFDTGWEAVPVLELIAAHQLRLRHIFITHAHHDHIAALPALRERFPEVPPSIEAKPSKVARGAAGCPVACGSLRVSRRAVPGHAEDGCVYLLGNWPDQAPLVAVVGDTLFAGSMARGFISAGVLRQKILEEILTLPPETLLCPGHGPVTTVAEEMAHNPFFPV
jgi:hydroxyacylglutathione hydrolase